VAAPDPWQTLATSTPMSEVADTGMAAYGR
jgi:hypothetical protein